MANFSLNEVCQVVNGKTKFTGEANFSGISIDSRTVKPGELFIAIIGEKFDGHDFVQRAVEQGAGGVLVSVEDAFDNLNVPVISTDDTLTALQCLARYHRLRFDIPLIAVTGSNGKTTTKDMTAAVLASRWNVLKTESNFNNEIGLPLTLLNINNHDAAVVELGMRGLGQIDELAKIALPTIGIVTNVGETHIELLGTIENIAAAKGELVEAVGETGLVILNGDDKYVRDMQKKARGKVLFYGLESHNDVKAADIAVTSAGINFNCIFGDTTFTLSIPVVGKHNVYNALAAVALGLELGLTVGEIRRSLSNFQPTKMRLTILEHQKYKIINDAYNASPASMRAALDALVDVSPGRKVAVLGDMLELGDIAIDAHRRIGHYAAKIGADVVITVGNLARHIAEAAHEHGVSDVVACQDHGQIQDILDQYLRPGDTILIKGSRGMQMEKIINML